MTENINYEALLQFIDSIKGLIDALINFFGTTFSWLGTPILTILGIGAVIAIVLRFFGR